MRAAPLAAVIALALAGAADAGAAAYARGSSGLGDSYLPKAGNGGYDVAHYDISLRYVPNRRRIAATTKITATATQGLSGFDLDFRGPKVKRLLVDGRRASFHRRGQELVVTPPTPIDPGSDFEVAVTYAGKVGPLRDQDGSLEGWIPTGDGAFVADEPTGAPTWFPCNDYPTDKATFAFRLTVPKGKKALGNGILTARIHRKRRTTFVWREDSPMATYLATATNGKFKLRRSTVDGRPSFVALDRREAAASKLTLLQLPSILEIFSRTFGGYPFAATGAIVDHAPRVGYALETQNQPLFSGAPIDIILAHEVAHQWFGDAVTPARWQDIWLNEGFATWSEWLWESQTGGDSLEESFKKFYDTPESANRFWNPPPGRPGGAGKLFSDSVYVRGALAIEALREKIGDETFGKLLRDWYSQHKYGNATIDDFIALAERESGQDLSRFFDVWLFQNGKPTKW